MISQIIEKLNEGGAAFTYPMVFVLIVITYYFIKALRTKSQLEVLSKLISNYGWFIVAWGCFGKAIGMIIAFDSLKKLTIGSITGQQLAGGLRVVIICSLLSFFIFSISRLYILILNNKSYYFNNRK
ncbi:hypothetical protein [Labilibacter marinus]|uniref:hypothetical protein n=1 Tax=Labilibacter marinus TaxID=1477105 RepID=UPI00082D4419|nr:hypothetical protein [Labilibacter marinus]